MVHALDSGMAKKNLNAAAFFVLADSRLFPILR
jgi:hypothetical protein